MRSDAVGNKSGAACNAVRSAAAAAGAVLRSELSHTHTATEAHGTDRRRRDAGLTGTQRTRVAASALARAA